jgi:hypothetical protein
MMRIVFNLPNVFLTVFCLYHTEDSGGIAGGEGAAGGRWYSLGDVTEAAFD